jgi:hypothetical protein
MDNPVTQQATAQAVAPFFIREKNGEVTCEENCWQTRWLNRFVRWFHLQWCVHLYESTELDSLASRVASLAQHVMTKTEREYQPQNPKETKFQERASDREFNAQKTYGAYKRVIFSKDAALWKKLQDIQRNKELASLPMGPQPLGRFEKLEQARIVELEKRLRCQIVLNSDIQPRIEDLIELARSPQTVDVRHEGQMDSAVYTATLQIIETEHISKLQEAYIQALQEDIFAAKPDMAAVTSVIGRWATWVTTNHPEFTFHFLVQFASKTMEYKEQWFPFLRQCFKEVIDAQNNFEGGQTTERMLEGLVASSDLRRKNYGIYEDLLKIWRAEMKRYLWGLASGSEHLQNPQALSTFLHQKISWTRDVEVNAEVSEIVRLSEYLHPFVQHIITPVQKQAGYSSQWNGLEQSVSKFRSDQNNAAHSSLWGRLEGRIHSIRSHGSLLDNEVLETALQDVIEILAKQGATVADCSRAQNLVDSLGLSIQSEALLQAVKRISEQIQSVTSGVVEFYESVLKKTAEILQNKDANIADCYRAEAIVNSLITWNQHTSKENVSLGIKIFQAMIPCILADKAVSHEDAAKTVHRLYRFVGYAGAQGPELQDLLLSSLLRGVVQTSGNKLKDQRVEDVILSYFTSRMKIFENAPPYLLADQIQQLLKMTRCFVEQANLPNTILRKCAQLLTTIVVSGAQDENSRSVLLDQCLEKVGYPATDESGVVILLLIKNLKLRPENGVKAWVEYNLKRMIQQFANPSEIQKWSSFLGQCLQSSGTIAKEASAWESFIQEYHKFFDAKSVTVTYSCPQFRKYASISDNYQGNDKQEIVEWLQSFPSYEVVDRVGRLAPIKIGDTQVSYDCTQIGKSVAAGKYFLELVNVITQKFSIEKSSAKKIATALLVRMASSSQIPGCFSAFTYFHNELVLDKSFSLLTNQCNEEITLIEGNPRQIKIIRRSVYEKKSVVDSCPARLIQVTSENVFRVDQLEQNPPVSWQEIVTFSPWVQGQSQ